MTYPPVTKYVIPKTISHTSPCMSLYWRHLPIITDYSHLKLDDFVYEKDCDHDEKPDHELDSSDYQLE